MYIQNCYAGNVIDQLVIDRLHVTLNSGASGGSWTDARRTRGTSINAICGRNGVERSISFG